MRTGSLFNHLMGQSVTKEPEVGDGATRLMWTDRHAATVIAVKAAKSGKNKGKVVAIAIREDKAIRADGHGMSDAQSYTYEPDPTGGVHHYTLRANGAWVRVGDTVRDGERLLVGVRRHYYDYSF